MTQVPYDWNNPVGPKPSGVTAVFNSVVQTIAVALHASFAHTRTGVLAGIALMLIGVVVSVALRIVQPGPDTAARAWMQALANQDGATLSELTCTSLRPQLQQSLLLPNAAMILGQGFIGTQVKTDINELNFTTTSNDGTHASVRITGTMHTGIGLFAQTQRIDAPTPMLNEGGKWRVCS